jgi:diacylglycerol O-acyltransferase
VLDPSTRPDGSLTREDVRRLFEARLHLLAPFRWRLVTVPLGLDYPYWIDDPSFDLDYHIREVPLGARGDQPKLAEQVELLIELPLDRSRPLWMVYLITGLEHGHVALLSKIHHAVIDGASGAEILSVILDDSPAGRDLAPATTLLPERMPRRSEMLRKGLRGVRLQPRRAASSVASALPHLDHTPLRALPGTAALSRAARRSFADDERDGGVLTTTPVRAPRTVFSDRLSPHRRVSFGSLPLDHVKAIKNRYGTTVNDVVVAACAGAVRRTLVDRGCLPTEPLIATVPVSVRSSAQRGTYGNRISFMYVPIATDEADPVRRLLRVHETLVVAKERHRAVPASVLQDVNHFIPPALLARAARASLGLAAHPRLRPPGNLIVSNVPGAVHALYFAGARLVSQHPFAPIIHGTALNMSLLSYGDQLDFGIVADRAQLPDAPRLFDDLKASLAELVSAVEQPQQAA